MTSSNSHGKNILLYEPEAGLAAVLAAAFAAAGLPTTPVTKIPTALAHDTWLVAGGPEPLLATRALRESSATNACFLLYPSADVEADVCPGLPKPFRLADVVTALMRLVTRPRDVLLGAYTLHVAARQLDMGGQRHETLTEKEVAILLRLAEAQSALSKEALLHDVWGYHPDATTHTLETHIYRLRQKLEKNPDKPQFLLTTEEGYRLQLA